MGTTGIGTGNGQKRCMMVIAFILLFMVILGGLARYLPRRFANHQIMTRANILAGILVGRWKDGSLQIMSDQSLTGHDEKLNLCWQADQTENSSPINSVTLTIYKKQGHPIWTCCVQEGK